MTVVQVQPDSAALERDMEVGAPVFAKFRDLFRLSTIEVFGDSGPWLLQLREDKARMLGEGTVVVHDLLAGFARFEVR